MFLYCRQRDLCETEVPQSKTRIFQAFDQSAPVILKESLIIIFIESKQRNLYIARRNIDGNASSHFISYHRRPEVFLM